MHLESLLAGPDSSAHVQRNPITFTERSSIIGSHDRLHWIGFCLPMHRILLDHSVEFQTVTVRSLWPVYQESPRI